MGSWGGLCCKRASGRAILALPRAFREGPPPRLRRVRPALSVGLPRSAPPGTAGRAADLPVVPGGADRGHTTESAGRARRNRGGGPSRNARGNARIARPLARLQHNPAHDHISSRLPATEPSAFRKTQGLGRHAPGSRATRPTNHRPSAKLFSVAASLPAAPELYGGGCETRRLNVEKDAPADVVQRATARVLPVGKLRRSHCAKRN